MKGLKNDSEKLRYELIPPKAIRELAKVLTYGAKKYAPNNWKKVRPFKSRYTGALLRHIELWRNGEKLDSESELSHLSHVLCNIVFLIEKEK